ncbi:hypothetical protein J2Z23_003021 [Lederbergia galactosidilyticus]|nr:DUF6157 family protein [Lederbergia galactosidilytica]MBP1916039.1 hypothetical protein [Lederbergia galactosidilytica]
MSYQNTFITVSEDSLVPEGIVPVVKNNKPTIASIEYDLIRINPINTPKQMFNLKRMF